MMSKLVMAVLVLGLACGSIFAAENSGFYAGAGVGYVSTKVEVSSESFSDSTTGWKVFVGYHPMKFFGFEGGYIDFGSPGGDIADTEGTTQKVKVSLSGYNLDLVGTIPLGKLFEVYGKAGYIWWDAKAEASSGSQKTNGDDWLYGAGAKLILAEKFGIRLEYEDFQIKDTKSFYLITLGAEWRF
jgi:OOP family OmpA-OmpF porin